MIMLTSLDASALMLIACCVEQRKMTLPLAEQLLGVLEGDAESVGAVLCGYRHSDTGEAAQIAASLQNWARHPNTSPPIPWSQPDITWEMDR